MAKTSSHRRYLIVLLMFLVIFINYMDRVNFSVSIPAIQHAFGFNLHQIGQIAFVWGLAYALFNFPGGWIADKLGLRWGMVVALGWWSLFTIATPFAGSLGMWFAIRALMGAGEAPIWPYNAKAVNSWAAPTERSTAYTWAGAGQYLGPAVGSVLAGWIVVHFGWHWTFIAFGAAGLVILPFWILVVRDRPEQDPRVQADELAWIGNAKDATNKPDWPGIRGLLLSRTGAGLLLIYLTFGYILFTFLYWVPSYMFYTFHMTILKSAVWSSIGSVLGFAGFFLSGPLNDFLAKRFERLTARRIGAVGPMLVGAACVALSLLTAKAGAAQTTAVLFGLAQMAMNTTVGAWAVIGIDAAPNEASTGIIYGILNGVLNLMGAFNSLILTGLASRYGFPAAFGSALVFMIVFMLSLLLILNREGFGTLEKKRKAFAS
ncbi:MFS transporter [Robbsia sp. Bb-Pol-6]|uniref:MFS transporter n=1 Tax=Robbsia betulipollinis TaxID=2981849 RepID=A0ABT3ZQF1_9BURK|nr:MFS transporter [Robbsia betulipollinis]MCY0388440.1 MFS transporter [Robbsia betulipollinis]